MNTHDPKTFAKEIASEFSTTIRSPDAFVAIDYDFFFLFLNNAAEKFYKRSKAELIGKKIKDIFPETWEFGPFKNSRKNVTAKKQFEMTYRSPFTDKWVLLVGRPFEKYYTFTYNNIDEKKSLNDELRAYVKRKKTGGHPTAK